MRSYKRTSDHLNMAVSHILNCQPAPKRPNTSHPQHLPSSESIGIRGGLCTHLTIATKVANSATTQMEQRVFSSIFFSHLKNKADEPVLKISSADATQWGLSSMFAPCPLHTHKIVGVFLCSCKLVWNLFSLLFVLQSEELKPGNVSQRQRSCACMYSTWKVGWGVLKPVHVAAGTPARSGGYVLWVGSLLMTGCTFGNVLEWLWGEFLTGCHMSSKNPVCPCSRTKKPSKQKSIASLLNTCKSCRSISVS